MLGWWGDDGIVHLEIFPVMIWLCIYGLGYELTIVCHDFHYLNFFILMLKNEKKNSRKREKLRKNSKTISAWHWWLAYILYSFLYWLISYLIFGHMFIVLLSFGGLVWVHDNTVTYLCFLVLLAINCKCRKSFFHLFSLYLWGQLQTM